MTTLPELPAEYTAFLQSHAGDLPYEYDDVSWWFATSGALLDATNIDGTEYPYIHQLRGYTRAIAEFIEGDATVDEDENDFPFTRLEAGLTIATGDGDVLFLDPSDDYSVWCFHHDGGDVEKLAESFGEWLSDAELNRDYE